MAGAEGFDGGGLTGGEVFAGGVDLGMPVESRAPGVGGCAVGLFVGRFAAAGLPAGAPAAGFAGRCGVFRSDLSCSSVITKLSELFFPVELN